MKEWFEENGKKILLYIIAFVLIAVILGAAINMAIYHYIGIDGVKSEQFFAPAVLLMKNTYLYGFVCVILLVVLYIAAGSGTPGKNAGKMLKSKVEGVEGNLENSRFLTDKEKDDLFPKKHFNSLGDEKKDGIAVYAVYNQKKKDLDINLMSPCHGIIIGATGSGKTTTFVNPVVQILGHASAGSSMICTDPKGELFQMHSKMLKEHGYNCMVLDLRDPYSSFRWNPLGTIYDMYQEYLKVGEEIYENSYPTE